MPTWKNLEIRNSQDSQLNVHLTPLYKNGFFTIATITLLDNFGVHTHVYGHKEHNRIFESNIDSTAGENLIWLPIHSDYLYRHENVMQLVQLEKWVPMHLHRVPICQNDFSFPSDIAFKAGILEAKRTGNVYSSASIQKSNISNMYAHSINA